MYFIKCVENFSNFTIADNYGDMTLNTKCVYMQYRCVNWYIILYVITYPKSCPRQYLALNLKRKIIINTISMVEE